MKKRKNKKCIIDADNRLFIIFMSVALVLLLVVWIIKDRPDKAKPEDVKMQEMAPNSFKKVSLSEVLNLIKKDKLTFVYLGYEGCSACDKFVPVLHDALDSYDFEVYYVNTKELNRDSREWKTFTGLLNKEVTLKIKEDGKEKSTKKTIGKFLYEEGYTPTFVVLKNNSLVDGKIGGLSLTNLEKFLSNVGFEEK